MGAIDVIVVSRDDRDKTSENTIPARNPLQISLPKFWNKQAHSAVASAVAARPRLSSRIAFLVGTADGDPRAPCRMRLVADAFLVTRARISGWTKRLQGSSSIAG